jgi:hypothetical protein
MKVEIEITNVLSVYDDMREAVEMDQKRLLDAIN